MSSLLQATLPALAGLLMLWAGVVALAIHGEPEIGARALARGTDGPMPTIRVLHVIHLASLTAAAALAGTVVAWWAYPPAVASIRLTLVALLVWAVGDLAPRLLAELAPEVVPFARVASRAVSPVFSPLVTLARRFEVTTAEAPAGHLRDSGVSPQQMAVGVFSLAQMTVSEVMTPRIDVAAVDVSESDADVLAAFRSSEHSRLLVYDQHSDAVVGVIYSKDMLPRLHAAPAIGGAWQDLIRPAAYVPEGKTLDRQLRDFQRGPAHLAVVVDEFGGTAGLLTLEDILEQIVGEIQDEYDVDEVVPLQRDAEGRLTVEGGVALVELQQELEHDFGRDDVATVGGLILAELGRVPRSGESVTIGRWRFTVDNVAKRRVRRVSIVAVDVDPVAMAEVSVA